MTSRGWMYTLALAIVGLGVMITIRLVGGDVVAESLAPKSATIRTTLDDRGVKSSPIASDAPAECLAYSRTHLTEANAGTELHLALTSQFGFCLEESEYPLADLQTLGCPFERMSDWSVRGLSRYPIGFQATETGECEVVNRDFRLRVLVTTHEGGHGH